MVALQDGLAARFGVCADGNEARESVGFVAEGDGSCGEESDEGDEYTQEAHDNRDMPGGTVLSSCEIIDSWCVWVNVLSLCLGICSMLTLSSR